MGLTRVQYGEVHVDGLACEDGEAKLHVDDFVDGVQGASLDSIIIQIADRLVIVEIQIPLAVPRHIVEAILETNFVKEPSRS